MDRVNRHSVGLDKRPARIGMAAVCCWHHRVSGAGVSGPVYWPVDTHAPPLPVLVARIVRCLLPLPCTTWTNPPQPGELPYRCEAPGSGLGDQGHACIYQLL